MFATFLPSRPSRDYFRCDFDRLIASCYPAGVTFNRSFAASSNLTPAVNVWENEGSYTLETELPGIASEDLEVTVAGKQLTLKGERKQPAQETETGHRKEITRGKFTRVMTFPRDLDSEKVQASLKDGVLRLELPISATAQPKKIAIGTQN